MTEHTDPRAPEDIGATLHAASAGLDAEKSDAAIDYEAVRRRFPWVGLGESREHDLSTRYREIMATARRNREIVEAIDVIRLGS